MRVLGEKLVRHPGPVKHTEEAGSPCLGPSLLTLVTTSAILQSLPDKFLPGQVRAGSQVPGLPPR